MITYLQFKKAIRIYSEILKKHEADKSIATHFYELLFGDDETVINTLNNVKFIGELEKMVESIMRNHHNQDEFLTDAEFSWLSNFLRRFKDYEDTKQLKFSFDKVLMTDEITIDEIITVNEVKPTIVVPRTIEKKEEKSDSIATDEADSYSSSGSSMRFFQSGDEFSSSTEEEVVDLTANGFALKK